MKSKEKLNDVLYSMLGSTTLVNRWWDGQNYHFNMSTPNEVWESSDEGKLEVAKYILSHAEGSYH
jgi:hypothetical protein